MGGEERSNVTGSYTCDSTTHVSFLCVSMEVQSYYFPRVTQDRPQSLH
jgi:hypothetical protein